MHPYQQPPAPKSSPKKLSVYSHEADPDDPVSFAAWFFLMIPPTEGSRNQNFPFPKPAIPGMCERLYKCGFRYHPELAEEFKIPLQPGMADLDPGQWVDCEEYEKFCDAPDGPEALKGQQVAMEHLKEHRPEVYELIKDMDVNQRREFAKTMKPQAESLLRAFKEILEDLEDEE